MNYTTAAKAALFINLSAMWVALLSPKLLGERFSRTKIVGVLFGLVGIVFVSTNLDFQSLMGGQIIGDLMLIISGVAWALFMIYNKQLLNELHLGDVPIYDLGGRIHDAFDRFHFRFWLAKVFRFKLAAWLAIFYTAIVCWVIPYYLWLEGLKHLSASTSTILLLSEIVIAVVLSILVLKEPITVFSTIGAFLIVIAIALVSK